MINFIIVVLCRAIKSIIIILLLNQSKAPATAHVDQQSLLACSPEIGSGGGVYALLALIGGVINMIDLSCWGRKMPPVCNVIEP